MRELDQLDVVAPFQLQAHARGVTRGAAPVELEVGQLEAEFDHARPAAADWRIDATSRTARSRCAGMKRPTRAAYSASPSANAATSAALEPAVANATPGAAKHAAAGMPRRSTSAPRRTA